jgi:hypothetical protein
MVTVSDTYPVWRQVMSESVFLLALTIIFGTFAFLGSLRFLSRWLEVRQSRRAPIAIEGLQERLDRIEAAVEATALEVERMSEANRFIAKLLSDRAGTTNLPAPPERVITPH